MNDDRVIIELLFSLREWAPKAARAWAVANGYNTDHVKINDYNVVVRLFNESETIRSSRMTEVVIGTPGLTIVTGCRKPHHVAA